MSRLLVGALVLLFWQFSNSSEAPTKSLEKNIDFKVFLDDREVGSHQFRLRQQGERLMVSSTMSLDFTILMVKKIKYRHQADEIWQDDCLISLDSQTEKLGKSFTVTADLGASGLEVINREGSQTIEGCAKGFAYWNPSYLKADFLLNAESGQYLPVQVSQTQSAENNITHMLIAGPKADVRLQYDAAGNWLSLESKLQIGGLLRYQRVFENTVTKGE